MSRVWFGAKKTHTFPQRTLKSKSGRNANPDCREILYQGRAGLSCCVVPWLDGITNCSWQLVAEAYRILVIHIPLTRPYFSRVELGKHRRFCVLRYLISKRTSQEIMLEPMSEFPLKSLSKEFKSNGPIHPESRTLKLERCIPEVQKNTLCHTMAWCLVTGEIEILD